MLKYMYVLQVSNPNWFATWDPRLGERAVMIRQASGDWGVLTGRWLSSPNETDGTFQPYPKVFLKWNSQLFFFLLHYMLKVP